MLWGDYFKAKKEYKRAEKYYIQAIDLDNTEKTAHIQLIVLYDRNTEQYDKVEEVLLEGVHNSTININQTPQMVL